MTAENTTIATTLRDMANDLRKQAEESKVQHAVKCAQILTAAQGLQQLRDILKGVR